MPPFRTAQGDLNRPAKVHKAGACRARSRTAAVTGLARPLPVPPGRAARAPNNRGGRDLALVLLCPGDRLPAATPAFIPRELTAYLAVHYRSGWVSKHKESYTGSSSHLALQGCSSREQFTPSAIQPGLEHCQRWAIHSFPGESVPEPYHPHRKKVNYIGISRYRKPTEFLKLTLNNYGDSTKFNNCKAVARLHH